MEKLGKQYFISGIDTDCGKTYVTGLLAKNLLDQGINVITAKQIQTGCKEISEDLEAHRKAMKVDLFPEDNKGITCPMILSFPASPHLAAEIDKVEIDPEYISSTINQLTQTYEIVLTEGAGGLMVPLTTNYLTIEYIRDHHLPLILVSSSKLGSINHTLLSLAAVKQYQLNLHTFIYNQMPNHDKIIAKSTLNYFKNYLQKEFPETRFFTNFDIEHLPLKMDLR